MGKPNPLSDSVELANNRARYDIQMIFSNFILKIMDVINLVVALDIVSSADSVAVAE